VSPLGDVLAGLSCDHQSQPKGHTAQGLLPRSTLAAGDVAGRYQVDDVTTAGEAVWSGVHGHTTLELTGFFGALGRDPVRSYGEILTRMSIGLGDDALTTARSLPTARRRSVRADRAEAASAR
jgi:hypothetical protein